MSPGASGGPSCQRDRGIHPPPPPVRALWQVQVRPGGRVASPPQCGLLANIPAPHEINFAPWPPCLSRCVCLSGQARSANPPFGPEADTGHQGTVGHGPGATIACKGNGAGAQMGPSAHSASWTPDSSYLPTMWTGVRPQILARKEAPSTRPWKPGWDSPGLSWVWGSSETPCPHKRVQPFHSPILGLVPLGRAVCTPGHPGLSLLQASLGPSDRGCLLGKGTTLQVWEGLRPLCS